MDNLQYLLCEVEKLKNTIAKKIAIFFNSDSVTEEVESLNFTGNVEVSNVGGAVTVNIPEADELSLDFVETVTGIAPIEVDDDDPKNLIISLADDFITFSPEGHVTAIETELGWELNLTGWNGEIEGDLTLDGNLIISGELQLNGDSGLAGQVITSGGDGIDPTWETPLQLSDLIDVADDYINDAAAAIGGKDVGELYHSSGSVKIRLI